MPFIAALAESQEERVLLKQEINWDATAFVIGDRQISYATFSSHIAHVQELLGPELAGQSIVGISEKLTNYQHWLVHCAATILGVATVAMRSDQQTYRDIPVIAPMDPAEQSRLILYPFGVSKNAPPESDVGSAHRSVLHKLISNPASLNRILLTTGSTGVAKDILQSNEAVLQRLLAIQQWITSISSISIANRKVLNLLGRDTLGGFFGPFLRMLEGSCSVFRGPGDPKNSYLQAIEAANYIAGSPGGFAALLQLREGPFVGCSDRELVSVGARMEKPLLEQIKQRMAAKVNSGYGSTETGLVAHYDMTDFDGDPSYVGRIGPGVQVEICDPDDIPVPLGTTGRIRVKTAEMVASYGRETSEGAFKDGWFYPGDRGLMTADGDLFVDGRDDDVLNIGGEKVLAPALESRLVETGLFSDVCLLEIDRGNTQTLLVMSVSEHDEQETLDALHRHLKYIPFTTMNVKQIPRNHMGKIERKALSQYAQRAMTAAEGSVSS